MRAGFDLLFRFFFYHGQIAVSQTLCQFLTGSGVDTLADHLRQCVAANLDNEFSAG